MRLKVKDCNDSRLINTKKLLNASNVEYSIIIDRDHQIGQILDSSGVTVVQASGNGSTEDMLQLLKNYMINSLSFKFFENNIKFDNSALSTPTAPTTNTLTPSAVPDFGAVTLRYNSVSATSSVAYSASASDIQASLRTIAPLADVTVSGTFASVVTITNGGILSPLTYSSTANTLQRNGQSRVAFSAVPDAGSFVLNYGGHATASIAFGATAAQVQAALRLVSGLSNVTVSGNFTSGFTTTLVGIVSPTAITVSSNSLTTAGGALTPVTTTVTVPVAYAAVTLTVA